jgi:hypothetical protein
MYKNPGIKTTQVLFMDSRIFVHEFIIHDKNLCCFYSRIFVHEVIIHDKNLRCFYCRIFVQIRTTQVLFMDNKFMYKNPGIKRRKFL